jgi:hypothetical protein
MIKFFRHIRQSLIMKEQKNEPTSVKTSTGRYLKYAIGEIVLVVIGILLALQINNWNEGEKRKRLKSNYIMSLLDDLRLDSSMVADQLNFYKKDTTVLGEQLRRIQAHPNRDTLVNIARNEFNTNLQIITAFNNKTYVTLVNTGDIELFEPWVIEELSRLDQFQKLAVSIYDFSISSYSDNLLNYRQHLTVFDDALAGDILDPIWDELSYTEVLKQVNLIATAKQTTGNNVLQFLPVYLEACKNLVAALKEEYKLEDN